MLIRIICVLLVVAIFAVFPSICVAQDAIGPSTGQSSPGEDDKDVTEEAKSPPETVVKAPTSPQQHTAPEKKWELNPYLFFGVVIVIVAGVAIWIYRKDAKG